MNPPLASLLVLPDGSCQGLYTEAIELSLLGPLEVKRASAIEFDNRVQAWRVRIRGLGNLYCSPSRENCLRWERQYLEARCADTLPA